ncbi:unnamed protein product [Lactuca virosa]|uniref:Uncharacterized protein n=1 Tax=Lactuca virosa TaxID=75947 RepID=A0AAU9NJW4_9ASTR|nr:unnamed protein product [Lactuca virosa]
MLSPIQSSSFNFSNIVGHHHHQNSNSETMTCKPLFFLFFLIFFHLLVMSFGYERQTFLTERFQPRRLLKTAASSLTSLSTDPSKLKGAAMNEPQTSVEDSLRKRPPSASNPSHN